MDPHVHTPHHVTATAPEVAPFLVSVDLRSAQVSVAGELDREHAHHVLDALAALSGTDRPVWTLEARRVTFCDAEGLRSLVVAQRLAHDHGRELSVLPGPCMHRLVLLVRLEELLGIPPARGTVLADTAGSRRSHPALAAVRELGRPAAKSGPAESAAG